MVLGKRYIKDNDILVTSYNDNMKRAEVKTNNEIYYCYCGEAIYLNEINNLEMRMFEKMRENQK